MFQIWWSSLKNDRYMGKGRNQNSCDGNTVKILSLLARQKMFSKAEVKLFLTLALDAWILSKFSTLYWICLLLVFLILVGVELPLCL